jgi:hypothetical protein
MIEQSTVDNLVHQHAELRAQVLGLQEQLQAANAAKVAYLTRFNAAQNSLQEGLQELDEDTADTVCDFLNGHSPWEFSLEQEYEVRCTMVIRVQARNADAAEQAVLDSHYTASDRDLEIENVEVDGVELA